MNATKPNTRRFYAGEKMWRAAIWMASFFIQMHVKSGAIMLIY